MECGHWIHCLARGDEKLHYQGDLIMKLKTLFELVSDGKLNAYQLPHCLQQKVESLARAK